MGSFLLNFNADVERYAIRTASLSRSWENLPLWRDRAHRLTIGCKLWTNSSCKMVIYAVQFWIQLVNVKAAPLHVQDLRTSIWSRLDSHGCFIYTCRDDRGCSLGILFPCISVKINECLDLFQSVTFMNMKQCDGIDILRIPLQIKQKGSRGILSLCLLCSWDANDVQTFLLRGKATITESLEAKLGFAFSSAAC
jgi:hypothetical protein